MRLALGLALPPRRSVITSIAGSIYDLDFASGTADAAALAAAGFTFARTGTAWTIEGTSYATGVPRITSRGLLMEGARTNLCLRSQEFDNAAWTKTSVTVTANDATAPDGAATADKIVEGASGATLRTTSAITVSAATNYTMSIYLKRGDYTWVRLLAGDDNAFTNRIAGWFDLLSGTKGSIAITGAVTSGGSTMRSLGSGWYRCSLTFSLNSAVTAFLGVVSASADAATTRADVGGGAGIGGYVHAWQAQLEAGGFASTPIVTTSAAVTRNNDNCSAVRSSGDFDAGTIALSYTTAVGADVNQCFFGCDLDANNRYTLYRSISGSNIQQILISATVTQAQGGASASTAPALTNGIVAARWAANNVSLAFQGSIPHNDTSATVPAAMVNERLGARNGGAEICHGYIRRIRRWPSALTDAQLQLLSITG